MARFGGFPRKGKYNTSDCYVVAGIVVETLVGFSDSLKRQAVRFASKREARHWLLLKARASAGEISLLRRQVRFELDVNGVHVCVYTADFTFVDPAGQYHVMDAKGFKTPEYELKKRLMAAVHNIAIEEV